MDDPSICDFKTVFPKETVWSDAGYNVCCKLYSQLTASVHAKIFDTHTCLNISTALVINVTRPLINTIPYARDEMRTLVKHCMQVLVWMEVQYAQFVSQTK
jgi:hypothetical protein